MGKKRNRHRPKQRPPGASSTSTPTSENAPDGSEPAEAERDEHSAPKTTAPTQREKRNETTKSGRSDAARGEGNRRKREKGARGGGGSGVTGRGSGAGRGVPGPAEPSFWFGFEVSWAKLATARVVLFGLLALDAIMQVRHAPRYGAGDFNVGQLGIDGLAPGRVGFEIAELLLAYLFVLVAFGVILRVALPLAAVIYAWLYFGSQLDSYQHHYLVALVLGIACFVPWRRPLEAEPATPVRTWAVRLLLVQLAVMYLWAAISKIDLAWVDGRTLNSQLTGALRSAIDATVGMKVVAVLVIATELVLAATVWLRPAWKIAAPLGVLFHAGIIATGLEIGLFAFLMLGMYVLVVPDRLWSAAAELQPVRALRRDASALVGKGGFAVWAIAIVVAFVIAIVTRYEHAIAIAVIALLVQLGLAAGARLLERPYPMTAVAAHVCAFLVFLAADRVTSVTFDYYKYWGGSQRRLHQVGESERAYRAMVAAFPGDGTGHYQLGRLLVGTGRVDEGLDELHDAQRLEPDHGRAWVEEARWLAMNRRVPEATEKLKQALAAEPANADAKALQQAIAGARPVRSSPPRATDDEVDTP